MKISEKDLSGHALVTAGLMGLILASIVACGDMVSSRGAIVIIPGSEQQVAEALRVKPSKLNPLKPDRKLAKKIKERMTDSFASSDTGDTGDTGGTDTGNGDTGSFDDATVSGGFEDCPTQTTTEEIDCEDVFGAAGLSETDSATEGSACTCTAKSWCEEDADGACMCYTAVSNCG